MTIKVLVVDDSALIRGLMTEIVNAQPDMQVVATAPDPLIARDLIKATNPDVLTLDVEMPKMDGLEFLRRLMHLRPMPVVMVSSLTEAGSQSTLRALELGAVDYVAKPHVSVRKGMLEFGDQIADKIRIAAKARILPRVSGAPAAGSGQPALRNPSAAREMLIAIGASTGGPEALKNFLVQMPADCPGIVMTQHMPESFTRSFASRLDKLSPLTVKQAEGGEIIQPGHAYLAPGHSHLKVVRRGTQYITVLDQGPPVNCHRPSVDVLFESVALAAGRNAVGVILTGMGKDGAAGMLKMKEAGAYNLAQDEASCVVFGMPREAIALGATHDVATLSELPGRVMMMLSAPGNRAIRV